MSIFSNIRKSRQQAKDHHAKVAEQKKKEQEDIVPYRHVPTHAAADAFASAPPSWREASDRPKIIEQNRRRSAMAVNGYPMNFPVPNFPRVGSSLSVVSYPGKKAPASRMPRAHSYAGVSPYADGSRDIIYSIPDVAHSEPECLQEQSPTDSNSDTASSSENLEMGSGKAPMTSPLQSAETPSGSSLHPNSRAQSTPEPPVERHTRASSAGPRAGPSSSRDTRPPPSTRGFHAIQQMAHPPPMQVGTAPVPLPADAIVPTVAESRYKSARSSRHNSSSSLPGLTPTSTKQPSPLSVASPLSSTPPSDFYLNHAPNHSLDVDFSYFNDRVGSFTAASEHSASRSSSKLGRFAETEPSASTQNKGSHEPMASPESDVVNFFPEPMSEAPKKAETPKSRSKSNRFSKASGGRLQKKSK